jgi:predicted nucleotidyltransferase
VADAHTLDLEESWLQTVQEILQRHVPDRPVFAFGSRTRGGTKRRSDLDLALGGAEMLSTRVMADLKEEFSESDLPIFVDLLDLNSVDPEFAKRIAADFVPVATPEQHV